MERHTAHAYTCADIQSCNVRRWTCFRRHPPQRRRRRRSESSSPRRSPPAGPNRSADRADSPQRSAETPPPARPSGRSPAPRHCHSPGRRRRPRSAPDRRPDRATSASRMTLPSSTGVNAGQRTPELPDGCADGRNDSGAAEGHGLHPNHHVRCQPAKVIIGQNIANITVARIVARRATRAKLNACGALSACPGNLGDARLIGGTDAEGQHQKPAHAPRTARRWQSWTGTSWRDVRPRSPARRRPVSCLSSAPHSDEPRGGQPRAACRATWRRGPPWRHRRLLPRRTRRDPPRPERPAS